MAIEEKILAEQLSQHAFDEMESKVSGIAERAVKEGWETLSPAQKRVLTPHLSNPCEGYTDPGGHRNECHVVLQDDSLLEAWNNNPQYDSLLCESCRSQIDYIAYERARREKE